VLQVVARLLRGADGLALAGCANNALGALSLVTACRPDVVVFSFPPRSPDEVQVWRRIREMGPRTMVLSTYLREHEVELSVLSGASAHLPALADEDWVRQSIICVSHGESLYPSERARLRELTRADERTELDAKDRLLLELILDETGDRRIAQELGIATDEVPHRIWQLAGNLTPALVAS
jgi:DNA-binding NarL/FixJ family response regulator